VTKQFVGGFPVETETTVNSGYWEKSKLDYVNAAEVLKTQLAARGVTPIAIIPTTWWDAMLKESGLWKLNPDREGKVGVEADKVAKIAQTSKAPALIWVFGMAGVITAGATLHWDLPLTVSSLGVSMVIGSVTTCGFTAALLGIFKKTGDRLNARAHAAYHLLRHGRNRVMGEMLSQSSYSTYRVGIRLPTPPQDVVDTLKKIASMGNIRVAAEPGAVGFAKSPTNIIADRILSNWEEEAREAARIRALDPIIFLEEGPAVAIVAQFGDFPIEKELVDKIVARQSSLRRD
jgi:hypothetical protein